MSSKKTKLDPLPQWERQYYKPSASPQLFYAIYGDLDENSFQVSRSTYACDGVPEGIEIEVYRDDDLPHMLWPFTDDPLKSLLLKDSVQLFNRARDAKSCVVIREEIEQDSDLNYLRDIIGLITALMDNGGEAVLDLYTFSLLSKNDWRTKFFDVPPPSYTNHVLILDSKEDDGTSWLHTRGMIKFGRPDISVHSVTAHDKKPMIDMINRMIALQAEGELVSEVQAIKMQGLQAGLKCYHQGDMDDPDFNNVHIEIR